MNLQKQQLDNTQTKPTIASKPNCARCHKPKKTRKHHYPLGSSRLVPLCDHCYGVVRKQRARASGHSGIY